MTSLSARPGGTRPGAPRLLSTCHPDGRKGRARLAREQAYVVLNDILRDVLDDAAIEVGDASPLAEVPGWDSLVQIAMLAAAEVRFGVTIAVAEAEGLARAGEVIDLVLAKLAAD